MCDMMDNFFFLLLRMSFFLCVTRLMGCITYELLGSFVQFDTHTHTHTHTQNIAWVYVT